MLQRLCSLIWLGALTISTASPDIVDVSVKGPVSGSGGVTVACAGNPFTTFPYSFSATNTSLDSFGDSGSATGAPCFPSAFASSFADQYTSATSNALDITLTGGHSAIFAPFYMASESDNISVSFDLTEPSMAELSGGGFGIGPEVGELLDSKGDVILTLPISSYPVFGDLGPGTYKLQAGASGGGSGVFAVDVNIVDFELGLDASFTPIPEPRGIFLTAILLAGLGGYVISRGVPKVPPPARS